MRKKEDRDIERISEDLAKQLKLLQERKESLSETLDKVEEILGSMQGVEFKLRGEIRDLVKSETKLNNKRVRLREQLATVEHEIAKLRQIFSELEAENA